MPLKLYHSPDPNVSDGLDQKDGLWLNTLVESFYDKNNGNKPIRYKCVDEEGKLIMGEIPSATPEICSNLIEGSELIKLIQGYRTLSHNGVFDIGLGILECAPP
jgi:hypothetical protein